MASLLLLGKGNGYLWFFAALMLSVAFIHGVDTIGKRNRALQCGLHGTFFLLALFLMCVLQFFYAPASQSVLSPITDLYYNHFDNVRNFVSGIFFCYIGYAGVRLRSHYSPTVNRVAIVVLIAVSIIGVGWSNAHNLWREGYTTLGISALLLFVILECASVECAPNRLLLYMRKSSNIIYFQHRYAIIVLSVFSHMVCPISPVVMFGLTVTIMCAVSYGFYRLEPTRWRKYTQYLY